MSSWQDWLWEAKVQNCFYRLYSCYFTGDRRSIIFYMTLPSIASSSFYFGFFTATKNKNKLQIIHKTINLNCDFWKLSNIRCSTGSCLVFISTVLLVFKNLFYCLQVNLQRVIDRFVTLLFCCFSSDLQEDFKDQWHWICTFHECWSEGTFCLPYAFFVSMLQLLNFIFVFIFKTFPYLVFLYFLFQGLKSLHRLLSIIRAEIFKYYHFLLLLWT